MATNMTDPLKVTLPPWRRGDGKPCEVPGLYACRSVDMRQPWDGGLSNKSAGYPMYEDAMYAGPIEFI